MKLARCVFTALMLAVLASQSVPCLAQYVDTAWVRRYSGPGNGADEAYAIAVDDSGNVYVTGGSIGDGTDYDYASVKYHPNGDTAWVRRYNGPGDSGDEATALAVDDSGNVFVTGKSVGSGTSDDYATVKYYPNGDTAWVRRYHGPGDLNDGAYSIAVNDSGNVYVTGYSYGNETAYDYATIKYYPNGDTAWVRRYCFPGNKHDEAWAISVDGFGNVYVTGRSQGSVTGYDYATVKYYSNGDTAWVRRYNGTGNDDDRGRAIAVDDSGNVYVTGYSWGSSTYNDYATIKYDSVGNELWVERYNGPRNWYDAAYGIALDGSGNVYVTGDDSHEGGSYDDYATIKYYSNGDTAWVRKYNGAGNYTDIPSDLAVDVSSNVYVTGQSYGSGTDFDYATIKYIQYDSIPFAPAVKYPVSGPLSVFCADLDADGDLDLAVSSSNGAFVLKNRGDATFESAVNYGTGDVSYSVFCADLDGDGDLDLAMPNEQIDNVSILKNNGDGTFELDSNYAVGSHPMRVFCADLDGDSDLDLAVANILSENVSILKNNGDGSFQSAVNYGVGDRTFSVFCADLDGDTDLDLAVAIPDDGNISILKNNGDATFQTGVDYPAGDSPYYISGADLDGDTDFDLTVGNWMSQNVTILKNNGDGVFQLDSSYAVGYDPWSVFCADLDGDSDLDLAVAQHLVTSGWDVSILKNVGDGTFQAKVGYDVEPYPYYAFCADLDGDLDLDMAVAGGADDSVSILKNLTQIPANQPPWSFSLISPTDEDTTFGSTAFLWQTPYDPNFGDQIRYDLHLSTDPGFDPDSTVVYDSLPLSGFTDALEMNIYYWKVRSYDNWGAETWSTEIWNFVVYPSARPDSMWVTAFSPVDLIVTDPIGDSIGIDFNTIPDADYDTTVDVNEDGDKDDLVTIPNPYVGEYLITVLREPDAADDDTFSIGIRVDGGSQFLLVQGDTVPPAGETIYYSCGCPAHLRGDLNKDNQTDVADVIVLINYLFIGGTPPDPLNLGDVNCDGSVDVSDLMYLINYLFLGTSAPCSGC